MTDFTPPDQPPGIDVISRYDASQGWAAGMDRKIRKEEAVEEFINYWLDEDRITSEISSEDITQSARDLLEKLKKIDRT